MRRLIGIAGLIVAAGLAGSLGNLDQGAWSTSPPDSITLAGASPADATQVSGSIASDQVWQSRVDLVDETSVEPGATLTILPGTVVLIRHCRDYTAEMCHKIGLSVSGKLIAEGTPDAPIVFTSDADDPSNGDWRFISFRDSQGSSIRYAVVEFGQQGVNIWNSDLTIADSTIRWNNWEGIYLESYATPIIERNHIYQNGSNGIAMEQYNDAVVRRNEIWGSRTHGIHVDASRAVVEQNILRDNLASGLSLDDSAVVVAVGNLVTGNAGPGIRCGEGENSVQEAANDLQGNSGPDTNCPPEAFSDASYALPTVSSLNLEAPDYGAYELGYIPGDPALDRYQYIFPAEDETRRVVNRIGKGLGLSWSLAWDGEAIWTSTLWGSIYRLDPEGGAVLKELTAPSPQPWGMTFDGDNLWISDFAEKTIYSLDPGTGGVVDSFPAPDVVGGAKGLAWDGQYLYAMGWTSPILYRLDRQGNVLGQVELEGGAGGGLTYDGANFWAPCGGICQFDRTGRLLGWIHAASDGTWDLAWDGQYLWASQRTNENWVDDKIYQIQILEPRRPAATVPTPTATPGGTATPIPGPTRTVTMPPGNWANFTWSGASSPQTVADCFGQGNVAVMYRLDAATGTFQRWIRGREDLSNMTDVQRFDALLALNASAQTATCIMPDDVVPYSLTIPAGRWASFAWLAPSFPAEVAPQACSEGSIAVIYRLDAATQTFQRWIRGRPELSNMTDVQPYDALLALNGSGQASTCTFSHYGQLAAGSS